MLNVKSVLPQNCDFVHLSFRPKKSDLLHNQIINELIEIINELIVPHGSLESSYPFHIS